MKKLEALLQKIKSNPTHVRFVDLLSLCEQYFGKARNNGTSHYVFKMPWAGDPRVNIQKSKGEKAKPYQVKQVLKAIARI